MVSTEVLFVATSENCMGISSNPMCMYQQELSIELNGRMVMIFVSVRYIVDIRYCRVSTKWGSTVIPIGCHSCVCQDTTVCSFEGLCSSLVPDIT